MFREDDQNLVEGIRRGTSRRTAGSSDEGRLKPNVIHVVGVVMLSRTLKQNVLPRRQVVLIVGNTRISIKSVARKESTICTKNKVMRSLHFWAESLTKLTDYLNL